jgi:hypothetical protein
MALYDRLCSGQVASGQVRTVTTSAISSSRRTRLLRSRTAALGGPAEAGQALQASQGLPAATTQQGIISALLATAGFAHAVELCMVHRATTHQVESAWSPCCLCRMSLLVALSLVPLAQHCTVE